MPMKLNIGLSRKIGEANYGSRGASINVELEVDTGLALDPTKLREKISQVFGLVRSSLTDELNGNGHGSPVSKNGGTQQRSNGNGATNQPRPATQSQIKAILAIAKAQKLDLRLMLQDRFRVARPDDLSIKDASFLIDELKKSPQQNGG
jgi:hypothetical protein